MSLMSSLSTSATPLITMATDMNVLDMPVDPNEPTYCLCHQVGYIFFALGSSGKRCVTTVKVTYFYVTIC